MEVKEQYPITDKMTKDFDFTDKQFYMLGSRLNPMQGFNMEFLNKNPYIPGELV